MSNSVKKAVHLALTWVNHVQVTKQGGHKVTRDESYSELVDSDDLLSRVLKRVRSAHGANSEQVTDAFNAYHADVKDALKSRNDTKRTVLKDGRKLFTYIIRPLKITLDNGDGCQYIVRDNGKIERVSGKPLINKLAPNLGDSEARIVVPVKETKAPKAGKKKGKKGKKDKKVVDKPKAGEYTQDACYNSRMAKTDTPIPPKETAKDSKKELTQKAKADKVKTQDKEVLQPTPQAKQVSKATQTELDKFKLDINNLPNEKPKGFPKKVWRKLIGA